MTGSDRPDRPVRRRVGYGQGPRRFVDLRQTSATEGCILLVHGGFWRAGKDSESLWPAVVALSGAAGCVGTVEYRTADAGGTWPHCHDDVVAAARAVWHDTGVRPEQTVLVGHSAGGQLVLTAAAELPRLAAVVALAAVSDLVAAQHDNLGDGAVRSLFGVVPVPEELLRAASPTYRPAPACRVEILHGTGDQAVPAEYSRTLAERWTSDGDVVLTEVAEARHMHLVNPQRPAWRTVAARIAAVSRRRPQGVV